MTATARRAPEGGARAVRLAFLAVAAAGLGWAAIAVPASLAAAPYVQAGARLAMKERYQPDTLRALAAAAAPALATAGCDTAAFKGALFAQAVVVEADLALSAEGAVPAKAALERLALRALACEPSQGFAWLILHWLASDGRAAPNGDPVALLAMSYRTAPREAWIALVRSGIALKGFDAFEDRLRAPIVAEWRDLVSGGFHEFAAAGFAVASARARPHLSAALSGMETATLRSLQRALDRAGVDAAIPGGGVPKPSYVR